MTLKCAKATVRVAPKVKAARIARRIRKAKAIEVHAMAGHGLSATQAQVRMRLAITALMIRNNPDF